MYRTVPSKWYFHMAMFIVHRKCYQAEEASRILDPLLSVYHLWCDWMSPARERRCFGELKVAGSPPGGDRRPVGWPLARPVAVAVSPHCWSWFIPYSRPPERGGLTPPPSMITAVAGCTVFSRTASRKWLRRSECFAYIWKTDRLEGSRDCSVGMVFSYKLDDRDSIPGRGRIFLTTQPSEPCSAGSKVTGAWNWYPFLCHKY